MLRGGGTLGLNGGSEVKKATGQASYVILNIVLPVILNLFQDLLYGSSEDKRVGRYAVISEQSSQNTCHCQSVERPSQSHNRDVLSIIKPHPCPLLEKEREQESVLARAKVNSPGRGDDIKFPKRTYSPKLVSLITHHCSLRRKAAFTLAEVLITLGIIGVVAAITMPVVIARYKAKVMEAQFKKTYSIVSNATRMLVYEGFSPYDEFGVRGTADDPINYAVDQYVRVLNAKLCVSRNDDSCAYANSKNNAMENLTGKSTYCGLPINRDRYALTKDNIAVFIGSYSPHYIMADINGPNKGPNRLGHDIHSFKIMPDNNIKPLVRGDHDSRLCSMEGTSLTDPYLGAGCTEYAIMNKNPDGEGDYWYNFLHSTK